MTEWLEDISVEDALQALQPEEKAACLRRAKRKIIAKVRIVEGIHQIQLDAPQDYLDRARSTLHGDYRRGLKKGQPKRFSFSKPNGIGSLIAKTAENLIENDRIAAVRRSVLEKPYVEDTPVVGDEIASSGAEDLSPEDSGRDYEDAGTHSQKGTFNPADSLDRNARENYSSNHRAVVQMSDALRAKNTRRRQLALKMIEIICEDPERFIDTTGESEMKRRFQPKTDEIAKAMDLKADTVSKVIGLLRAELAALGATSFPELMKLMGEGEDASSTSVNGLHDGRRTSAKSANPLNPYDQGEYRAQD